MRYIIYCCTGTGTKHWHPAALICFLEKTNLKCILGKLSRVGSLRQLLRTNDSIWSHYTYCLIPGSSSCCVKTYFWIEGTLPKDPEITKTSSILRSGLTTSCLLRPGWWSLAFGLSLKPSPPASYCPYGRDAARHGKHSSPQNDAGGSGMPC